MKNILITILILFFAFNVHFTFSQDSTMAHEISGDVPELIRGDPPTRRDRRSDERGVISGGHNGDGFTNHVDDEWVVGFSARGVTGDVD